MTVVCTRCKAENPSQKRFCGDCGAPLDPAFSAITEFLGVNLREQVLAVVKEQYKDQKVLEVETTQAIATRLADWAKLLGFFVGIPIAIVLVLLGLIGIRTYSDFSNQIQKAQSEIGAKLDDAQKRAGKLQSDGATLAGEYEKLAVELGNSKAIAVRVEALTKDYNQLAAGLEKTKLLASRVESLDRKVVNIENTIRSGLVLGNSQYPNLGNGNQLQRAVNDAEAVGDALQGLGFKITKGENLSRERMSKLISAFSSEIQPGDTVFIFYSGHGISVSGSNYLVPSDALSPTDDLQLHAAFIAEDEIVAAMQASNARVVVLVIDACRNDPFGESRKSRGISVTGLKPRAGPGIFKLYSAGAGQIALDSLSQEDHNPNSVFTRVLVSTLKRPGIDLDELAQAVREEVVRLAQSVGVSQDPSYYDETIGGRIYLTGRVVSSP